MDGHRSYASADEQEFQWFDLAPVLAGLTDASTCSHRVMRITTTRARLTAWKSESPCVPEASAYSLVRSLVPPSHCQLVLPKSDILSQLGG
jgi:hypothetical protein